eukprot:scaffold7214_cov410-Prasinococcus_capsulatus_cf.AAC.15
MGRALTANSGGRVEESTRAAIPCITCSISVAFKCAVGRGPCRVGNRRQSGPPPSGSLSEVPSSSTEPSSSPHGPAGRPGSHSPAEEGEVAVPPVPGHPSIPSRGRRRRRTWPERRPATCVGIIDRSCILATAEPASGRFPPRELERGRMRIPESSPGGRPRGGRRGGLVAPSAST